MHLAATSLGLGSVYVGGILEALRDMPELDKTAILGLPEGFEPLMGLMLGHPKLPLKDKPLIADKLPVNYV
jgi:nitroreductase